MAKSSLPDSGSVEGASFMDVRPHIRYIGYQALDQRRQELEQAGVDHAKIECPARLLRIEGNVLGAQRARAVENGPNRRLQLQGFRRRLHAQRHAHEQGVVKIAA